MMARFTIVVILSALLSSPAWACSCIFEMPSLKSHLEEKIVFIGKAVETRELIIERGNGERPTQPYLLTTFQVIECWQGDCSETIDIQHYSTSNSCGRVYDMRHPIMIITKKSQHGFYFHSPCEDVHPAMVQVTLRDDIDFSYPDSRACEKAWNAEQRRLPQNKTAAECRRWIDFERQRGNKTLWLYNNLDAGF